MKELVFHIGLHKTGTTWLQKNFLSKHPGIELVTNYSTPWDDAFLKYLIGTTERKFDILQCRKILNNRLPKDQPTSKKIFLVSAERLSGHPYSGGYDSFNLSERIHSCFPEAQIIFTIRNQVDIILSAYKQLVLEGYRGTLSELIRTKHWKGVGFSLDMYEYNLIIEKYYSLFSPDKVLVLLHEDFKKNPILFVQMISNFLNVTHFVPSNIKTATHKSLKDSDIAFIRVLNHFRKSELNPFPLLEINNKLLKFIRGFLAIFPNKMTLFNMKDQDYIREYYKQSNLRLKKLLNYDFSEYTV